MEHPQLRPHSQQRPLSGRALKERLVAYQATVLQASQEAENGIVTFLRSQVQAKLMQESVGGEQGGQIVVFQYRKGAADFNRYATIEQALVTQQADCAGPRADRPGVGANYRALGGGWNALPGPAGVPPNPYRPARASPAAAVAAHRAPETIPSPAGRAAGDKGGPRSE